MTTAPLDVGPTPPGSIGKWGTPAVATLGEMLARRIIGVILVVIGGVWIAQGSGALHGSFMTGEGIWTVIGVIAALFGIALLVGAARDRKRTARDDQPE